MQDFSLERFVPVNLISDAGAFSKVYKIRDKETNEIFAAKVFKKPINSNSKDSIIFFVREVDYNSRMNHPSVLKFFGYSNTDFEGKPKPVIVTEYCKNLALSTFIESLNEDPNVWNDTRKLITIFGIASGMKYLHENNIIHRDLKPDNILMDDNLCPKIADFGFSKRIDSNGNSISTIESQKCAKGTPIFIAPEVFMTNESTKESDVYAFGILVYEIVTNLIPYEGLRYEQLVIYVSKGNRPLFVNENDNDPYQNLIRKCWSNDPKDRPTFNEIVEELKSNQNFITSDVNEKEYKMYVDYIEKSPSSFINPGIIRIEDYIDVSATKTFSNIDIKDYLEQKNKSIFSLLMSKIKLTQDNLYPTQDFMNLNDQCKQLVIEAENNPEKQFYIGTYLIKGQNNFPLNVDLGIKYLERSISKGNVNSALYLSKILVDGILIAKDYKKAMSYLSKFYRKDDRIYYPYGKVLKKLNKLDESRKSFKEGSEKGKEEDIINCMYEYAKLLFCGLGGRKDMQKAIEYFNISKNKGFQKSDNFLKIFDQMNENKSFSYLPSDYQYFFIKKIIKNDARKPSDHLKMNFNETEKFFVQNAFKLTPFLNILRLYNTISIEILYPSKLYKSILTQLTCFKQSFTSKVIICVNISEMPEIPLLDKAIDIVDIKYGIQKIPKQAFEGCSSLMKIKIPSSVALIEELAFHGCSSLTEIIIPFNVTSIKEGVFQECLSMTGIRIPPYVTSIEENAFSCCSKLVEVTISSLLIYIGNYAFSYCPALTKITIPSSVISIGECSFRECTSLKEIIIPSSVTSIGSFAFTGCSKLAEITINASVTSIEENCFNGCSSLIKINIPSSVTYIKEAAFRGCSSLKEIIIPSSVVSIGKFAFSYCSELSNVTISSLLTYIGYYAFSYCAKLSEMTIPSSVNLIEEGAFRGCSSLKEIIIPSSVTSIEKNTFSECSALTEIKIPSSLTIKNDAFPPHTKITKI